MGSSAYRKPNIGRSTMTELSARRRVMVSEFRNFVNQTAYLTDCERHDGGWVISSAGRWVRKRDASWDNPYRRQNERDPVVLVSGLDAVRFANWRSGREALTPAYRLIRAGDDLSVEFDPASDGYRLLSAWECEAAQAQLSERVAESSVLRGKNSLSVSGGPHDNNLSGIGAFDWCWEPIDGPQPAGADRIETSLIISLRLCPDPLAAERGLDLHYASAPQTTSNIVGFRLRTGYAPP